MRALKKRNYCLSFENIKKAERRVLVEVET